MLLSPKDADLFFKLYGSLLHFANRQLNVVSNFVGPDRFPTLAPEMKLKVRNAFLEHVDLINSFLSENSANLSQDEIDIVLSWHHLVSGKFYAFRQLKKYTVFLSTDDPPVAYGVVALTEPFENLIGYRLPVMTEAMLMPFKDKIIYDGTLNKYNISFGGGVKRMLNDTYRQAKERLGIVTSLPIASIPISTKKVTTQRKAKKVKRSGAQAVKPVLEVIVRMTDDFGDGWKHKVIFEGRSPAEPGQRYPRCIDGARCCPPEDVGSVWGHVDFLEAFADPQHEEHEDDTAWVGDFDPEQFDPEKTTKAMWQGLADSRHM